MCNKTKQKKQTKNFSLVELVLRKMQIKTARYHYTPTGMAKIKE